MKVTPRLLVLGAITLVAISCGEPTAADVDSPASPQGDLTLWPLPHGLLQCTPLPPDSVTQTVGPEGGVLQVGPHTLAIPAGALSDSVSITAVAPSATVNRVDFQPAGLTFNQPASLTMSYANCGLLRLLLPKRIAYTTDLLEILEFIPSIDRWRQLKVTGQVEHFSTYAIAW